MKGEVFQLCSVITAAKNALNTQTFIQYEPLSYERGTVFQFVPEVEGQKGEMIEGVDSWYARCVYNGMEDVKILAPTAVKDRRVLGFVNTSQNIMLCFYPDDVIHMWMPRWVMDKDRKGWHIIYTEKIWENHPAGKPEYKDNTEIFKAALAEISRFSKELGFEGWSNVFNRSIAMLEGGFDYAADDEKIFEEFKKKGRSMPPRTHLELPGHNRDLFEAASNADVFGSMGSWNDGPAAKAAAEGKLEEYNKLSDMLFNQIALAVMYAINQW